MRKVISLLLAVAFIFLTSACHTIKYTKDGAEVGDKKKVAYLIGLAPLGNNDFKTGPQYEEKYEFVDYVITLVTLGIISTRTVEKK